MPRTEAFNSVRDKDRWFLAGLESAPRTAVVRARTGGRAWRFTCKLRTLHIASFFLEHPAVRTKKDGWSRIDPREPKIQTKRVESHIREAIKAGWDPNSRTAKAFHISGF